MFTLKLTLTFGRDPEESEPELIPGEGGPGSAQVEAVEPCEYPAMQIGFYRDPDAL